MHDVYVVDCSDHTLYIEIKVQFVHTSFKIEIFLGILLQTLLSSTADGSKEVFAYVLG
jgi:hypothetical protein